MTVVDRAMDVARARRARVVFPEAEEPRVAAALEDIRAQGLAVPVPLASPSDAQLAALVTARGMAEPVARRMLDRPMIRAAAMVAAGEADAMVAGIAAPTRKVIEAAGLAIGLAPGVTVPSSFFLMLFPGGRTMIWADCAVTVAPDAEALAAIARASAASCAALIGPPRGVILSYSTGSSGVGDSVARVAQAAQMSGFAGPVQADTALNAAIAATKGVPFADPNVVVFPSLDAGNIAYKLAQELAGAQAIGPILQGFARPVCDLSRGASPADIVAATVLTLAL